MIGQKWTQCLILAEVTAVCFLVLFAAAFVIDLLENAREGISGYIRS